MSLIPNCMSEEECDGQLYVSTWRDYSPVIQSSTKLIIVMKIFHRYVYIYNPLTLNKGDYPPYCGLTNPIN